jgi:FAD/FMN-containing dehydrogenase
MGALPGRPQTGAYASWRDQLGAMLADAVAQYGSALAFGNGRSYGDSCLAATNHVLCTQRLDRYLWADWHAGVVRVEAGMTLDTLQHAAIRHGWMLAVSPGTKFATVAGALANDVHGKNHHVRGTFGRYVRRFGLVRSDAGFIECAPHERPDLFAATIGGLGLTGVITWVELQLMQVASSLINVTHLRFATLDEFFALSEAHDRDHEYSVAWVDCSSRGAALGRGVLTLGDHASVGGLQVAERKRRTVSFTVPLKKPLKGPLKMPFTPPFSLVNAISVPAFNALYYRRQRSGPSRASVDFDRFLYPLDGLLEWHRIYGPRGFQQYQCVVPPAAARDAIREILNAIAASRSGSFLAVLKRCGALPSPGLLSFPFEGTSLALDFTQRDVSNRQLFDRLDAIVRAAAGRLYPAKDAHMSGDDFRRAYPAWPRVEALRDAALMSRFWQRTTQI